MADEQAPSFVDPAHPILAGSNDVNDDGRAELWDIFHNSKDHSELARKLQSMAVPDDLKSQLYDAKKQSAPPVEPLDNATKALNRIGQMDPKILELAEKYPNVAKILSAAASSASKDAGKAAEGGKSASKGKESKKEEEAPAFKPDIKATPAGHALVRTHDGGLHHIPHQNIDKAKEIDPDLQVLHVEP